MRAAGRYLDRVVVERPTAVVDTLGERPNEWTPVREVWCRVEALRAREFFAAGQTQSPCDYKVAVRPEVGARLDETMRLVWQGRALAITSCPRVPTVAGEVELLCTSGALDGRD